MKSFITILFSFSFGIAFSQARLVLNNDAYVVIDNNAFVVLDNSNPNAITLTGTGGKIKSEAEGNRVRWRGVGVGNFTIPFADNIGEGGTKIPYTLTIGVAGMSGATPHIDFSTYDGPTWDNATYMPSMVTHMGQLNAPNAVNHSDYAIDRFWVINAQGYTTKPTPSSMVFSYNDNEHSAVGNTLPEANLGAQRFNDGGNTWGDMLPIGVVNTVANTVTTPAIALADFYTAWTLSDVNDPLPVKLTDYRAECNNGTTLIKWTTQTEINNDYFVLEKSFDGYVFFEVSRINGNGNSNTTNNYQTTVASDNKLVYFRLKQVDFDGTVNYYNIISSNCSTKGFDVLVPVLTSNELSFIIKTDEDDKFNVVLYDYKGRLITEKSEFATKGLNAVKISNIDLSAGIYVLSIVGQNQVYTTKLFRR